MPLSKCRSMRRLRREKKSFHERDELQHLSRVTSERTEGQPKIWGKNPLN